MTTLKEKMNNEEFVTIVSVGNSFSENGFCDSTIDSQKTVNDIPFVTVLSIGQTIVEEEVIVYRLPGEKLGFGLKFEGGTKSAERVRRLFIQSCAVESPAGRTRAAWGPLDAGDEILTIDSVPVTSLTRLECVRCLKDSNVAVKLLVRHTPEGKNLLLEGSNSVQSIKNGTDVDHSLSEQEKTLLPPPVPPRKLPRRNTKEILNCDASYVNGGSKISTFEVNSSLNDNGKKLDNHSKLVDSLSAIDNSRKTPLGKQSPARPRRPVPVHNAPPPEPQVYTDLFCQEKENGIHIAESESDDTGSSISTVIDRLSSYSSFPGSVENSIPSTPTLGTKQMNLHVLTSIENMDEKFISDISSRFIDDITNKDVAKQNVKMINPSEKSSNNDNALSSGDICGTQENVRPLSIPVSTSKEITNSKTEHYLRHYNNDANNNTNEIKINEDVVDYSVNKTITEVPKPLPRNLSKRNLDSHLQSDYSRIDRLYEDNLSPTKLHNIETWLQDAINVNNFEDVKDQQHEYEREMVKPEALPRLIDFVPKSQYGTNQVELIIQQKEPPVATERKEKPDYNLKLTINIDKESNSMKVEDLLTDWSYGGGSSPQLETIGEDDEDSPGGGPTLPIIKVTQQPSNGLTNVEIDCQPSVNEIAKSTSSDESTFSDVSANDRNDVFTNKDDKSTIICEAEECAVNPVASRGTRSPPDGRENPVNHQENESIFQSFEKYNNKISSESSVKATNYLMKDSIMVETSPRISYEPLTKTKIMPTKIYGRGKDAKSEGSVKDKIAMFSVHKTTPDEKKLCRSVKSAETKSQNRFSSVFYDSLSKSHESLLDSSILCSGKSGKIEKAIADWSVNGLSNKSPEVTTNTNNTCRSDFTPSPILSFNNKFSYDNRSLEKEAIVSSAIMSKNVQSIEKTRTDSHRSTIDYLIEQRRKSMTKLRGLVIPDSPCISDLPEIKNRDSLKSLSSAPIADKTNTLDRYTNKSKSATIPTFLPSLWDSQSTANNVPKYSPAFKRKPLQVYGPKTTSTSTSTTPPPSKSTTGICNGENKQESTATKKSSIPSKPPRTSLEMRRPFEQVDCAKKTNTLPSNFRGSTAVTNPINYTSSTKPKRHELFSVIDTVDHANIKIFKTFSDTADSDNDSAVSSTQSSYLSTVSSPTPSINTADNSESDCSNQSTLSRDVIASAKTAMGKIINNHEENGLNRNYSKRNVCRSLSSETSTSVGSSNSSTLTSGSQASCSSAGSSNPDTGSHRILKPKSIEAINRKNILASAKCRSGKDNKFGSPLIERKFSDDSTVESTDECETKKPQLLTNGKSSVVRYHNIKNASSYTGDAVLKVAYSTLVEDKCSSLKKQDVDCTCSSDTGSESEADVGIPVKVDVKTTKVKKYNNNNNNNTVTPMLQPEKSISNDYFAEQQRIRKRVVTNKSNAIETPIRVAADGYETPKMHDHVLQENEQCFEVRLSRGEGGGVGVTLAGGTDCEAKEVTIHKVLQGSAAERDGRLCKGDQVISINGYSMKGVTHSQSVAILKDPQPEVRIVIRGKRPSSDVSNSNSTTGATISVALEKADAPGGAGLGISLEGGGNKPLLINKLFTGGAAARSGRIVSGSELLAAGDVKLVGLTRTEAWGLLRALPPGPVTLVLRPP